jgi:hypothetical protein
MGTRLGELPGEAIFLAMRHSAELLAYRHLFETPATPSGLRMSRHCERWSPCGKAMICSRMRLSESYTLHTGHEMLFCLCGTSHNCDREQQAL